jgi:hypothetical protein
MPLDLDRWLLRPLGIELVLQRLVQPLVARQPAGDQHDARRTDRWSSRAKRNAMLSWIPRRMLGALTPCETMLNP